MAGVAFKLEVRGLDQIGAMLARLGSFDIVELQKAIGEEMQEVSREHIDSRTTPDGAPMAKWSDSYRKRASQDSRKDILRGPEARLQSSITWQVKSDGLYYGSAMVYAGVHQFGWPDRNIPERPYLGIGQQERYRIEETLQGFMESMGL